MRSFMMCSIVLAGVIALAADSTPPAGNLVANPSFEERSGPRKDYPAEPWGYGMFDGVARSPFAHWGYSGFWDGGDYDIKLGKGRAGAACARLVCRSRGRGGVATEAITVDVGAKLEFRGWFKGVAAKGRCWVNFEGDPGDGWAQIALPAEADYDWKEVTGVVTVPALKKQPKDVPEGQARITVFIYTTAYGELWIDDVTLTPVAAEPAK
jgi:hypothetical protein